MKEIVLMVSMKEQELIIMKEVIVMKENGKMDYSMEKEYYIMIMKLII